jgi:hypothetical protein
VAARNAIYPRPAGALFGILFLVYALPELLGFQLWPSFFIDSGTGLPHNVDTTTFALGYRPMREFIVNELLSGNIPAWLYTQNLGLPLIEQYEYQIFNPLEWMNWLGKDHWWTIVLWLQMAAAAYGVYLFCRRHLALPALAACGGGLAYTVAGYAPWFFTVSSFITAVPPLPFIFLFALSQQWVGLTISLALLILCGQPQITFCAFLFGGIYLLWMRVPVSKLVLCSLLALMLAAPQVVPFVENQLSGESFSTHPLAIGESGWGTPILTLFNPVSAFLNGPINPWVSTSLRAPDMQDFALSFGVVGFFLILTGARLKLAVMLFGTFALVAVYSLGAAVWPFSFVNLTRYVTPVMAFFGAVLIASGIAALADATRRKVLLCAGVACSVPLFHGVLLYFTFKQEVAPPWHSLSLIGVSLALVLLLLLRRTAWAALLIFTAEATFLFRYGFKLDQDLLRLIPLAFIIAAVWRPVLAYGAVATVIAGWLVYKAPEDRQAPTMPNVAVTDRILAFNHNWQGRLFPNLPSAYGINSFSGRNPIQSLSFVGYFWQFLRPDVLASGQVTINPMMLEGVSKSNVPHPANSLTWNEYLAQRRYFNLIGINVLVDSGPLQEILRKNPQEGLVEIEREKMPAYPFSEKIVVFRDTHALPKAYLSTSYTSAPYTPDGWAARGVLDTAPVIERKYPPHFNGVVVPIVDPTDKSITPIHVTNYASNDVSLRIDPSMAGLVVLNDAYHPKWAAYVDGKKAEIVRVNSVVRGVIVQKGATTVRFVYRHNLAFYALISLAGFVILAMWAGKLNRFTEILKKVRLA